MIKNMKICTKLILGYGLVLVLLITVMGIYQYTIQSTTESFNRLMKQEMAMATSSAEIDVAMLQCRRNEKDFLLRLDMKYPEELEKSLTALKGHADTLKKIAGKAGDKETALRAEEITGYAEAYAVAFRQLVTAWQTRGLDHNSGLQGNFRKAAHDLEDSVDTVRVPNAKALLLQIRRDEKDYLLRGDDKYVKKTHQSIINLLTAYQNADISKELFEAADNKLKGYKTAFDQLVAEDANITKYTAVMRDEVHKIEPVVESLRKMAMQAASESMKANEQTTYQASYIALGIGLSAIVIGILAAFFLIRNIINPVKLVVARIKDVSEGEGDLTMRIDVKSGDETGELAMWFNTFVGKIHKIISDIAVGIETLRSSSTELSAISQQLSASSEQTSGKSGTVASAAEEMSSNMNTVAAALEETSTNTGMIASSAEQMTDSINEIAQNSERARSITGSAVLKVEGSAERVRELGDAAKEVSKVTETITDISEQTNLLALNATIEAARAGEAGKGFAVVANEIKELARQTAEATDEIKERIKGIQNSVSGTISDIEEVPRVISEVNDIVSTIASAVEEQSVTTREIAENVAQASSGIGEVTENVAQSSNVSGEIAREVAEVNQAAGEIANASSQVNVSAGELSELAERLNVMVGHFKV